MLFAPPSLNRPTWNTATVVEPKEYVSGSSSVWWKFWVVVYGSVLTVVIGTLANAVDAMARTAPMTATTSVARPSKLLV